MTMTKPHAEVCIMLGAFLVGLGCDSGSNAEPSASTSSGGDGGSVSNAGGSAGVGGAGTPQGGATQNASSSTTVGSGGVGTTGSGLGGSSAGSAGAAGAPGSDLGPCFEYLAAGQRCDDGASRAQSDSYEKLDSAKTLEDCAAACRERDDCTAIVDYFGQGALPLCILQLGTCNSPAEQDYAEEDAGKEYRKSCNGDDCQYDYLGDWIRCESSGSNSSMVVEEAQNIDDCFAACTADPQCTAVTDYFWLAEVKGCYLFTGECNAAEPLPYGDPGLTFANLCE